MQNPALQKPLCDRLVMMIFVFVLSFHPPCSLPMKKHVSGLIRELQGTLSHGYRMSTVVSIAAWLLPMADRLSTCTLPGHLCTGSSFEREVVERKKARPARVKFPRFNQLHSTTSSSTFNKVSSSLLPHSHTHSLSSQQQNKKRLDLGESKRGKESRKKKEFTIANADKWEKSKPQAAHEAAQVCMLPRFASSRVCPSACWRLVCVFV